MSEVGDLPLVVLAGGRSSRMGEPKGLVSVGGRALVELQLERFARAGGRSAVVVLGHDAERYIETLEWLREAVSSDARFAELSVRAVLNVTPELGPFSSLVCGSSKVLEGDHAGAFVLPVDVPAAGTVVWQTLAKALHGAVSVAIPETREGRGGHPVALARAFMMTLSQIDPHAVDARLDVQLRGLSASERVRILVDDAAIVLNLNTRSELERYEVS